MVTMNGALNAPPLIGRAHLQCSSTWVPPGCWSRWLRSCRAGTGNGPLETGTSPPHNLECQQRHSVVHFASRGGLAEVTVSFHRSVGCSGLVFGCITTYLKWSDNADGGELGYCTKQSVDICCCKYWTDAFRIIPSSLSDLNYVGDLHNMQARKTRIIVFNVCSRAYQYIVRLTT